MLNSLSFCLSVKVLISPSYLNEILAGYSNLGCRFFSFITLSMSCHNPNPSPFWSEEFLLKDQLLSLWESPCVLFFVFPLLLLIFVLCVWSLLMQSHFLGRLIRSLGVSKERGVWNSHGGRKDKLFFFPSLHSLGLYNKNVSRLRTVSGLNLLANSVILKCKLWE